MAATQALEPLLGMCWGKLPSGIFSPAHLAWGADDDFVRLLGRVDVWARENISAEEFDRAGAIPADVMKGVGELGAFGANIPTEFGGLGLGMTAYARMAELLAYHDPAIAITAGAHTSIATKGILLYGTEEQKRRFLPRLATGEWLAAFCLTEENAGSDAQAIETTAQPEGQGYVLNGRKIFSTNAGLAHVFTVFAREVGGKGITAFVVTADMPGVERVEGAEKLGLRAANVGTVVLKDVFVPVENRLGNPGEGFRMALRILNTGRLGLASSYLGPMKLALERSVAYASTRVTFGQPLIDNEIIAGMIAEIGDHVFALESMTALACGLWDSGFCEPGLEAALNKIYASESAWRCADLAMQIHGGNGFMCNWPLERMLRDVRIGRIFEGPNEILRLFVASKLLKEKSAPWKAVGERRKRAAGLADRAAVLAQMGLVWAQERSRERVSVDTRREELAPELRWEARCLAEAIQSFRQSASKLLVRYRSFHALARRQLHLARLSDMALHCWRMTAVVARMNARYRSGTVPEGEGNVALRVLADSLRQIERLRVEIRDDVGHDTTDSAAYYRRKGGYPFAFHAYGDSHG